MIILNDINNTAQQDNDFTKYIYINNSSISPDCCSEIIELFETSKAKYHGITAGGVQKTIKDTTDLVMEDPVYKDINVMLMNELMYNLKEYMKTLDSEDFKSKNNNSTTSDFEILSLNSIKHVSKFMTQKYIKNVGRYTYHNDFSAEPSAHRLITYLWYLNDVVEGGETAFSGKYIIKPKKGTLVLFPASWTFPHCGKMPISNDKYIITGWIYANNTKFKN